MTDQTDTDPADCCTFTEAEARELGWHWLPDVGLWCCRHGSHPSTCRDGCRDLLPDCCWDQPLRVTGYGLSVPLLAVAHAPHDLDTLDTRAGLVRRRLASLRLPPLWHGYRDPLDRYASGRPADGATAT